MRIPPAPVDGPDADAEAVARIRELRTGRISTLYRTLLHAGNVAAAWCGLGTAIRWETSLDERTRELVTCLVAALFDADYEWANHAPLAERAGVAPEQLAALPQWRDAGFDAGDEAVLAFAEAVATGTVDDAVFDRASATLDRRVLVEVAATAAYYVAVGRFLDAFEVGAADA
ncbi:carboxymuconolactone decarboxylase family protein [Egibacter rhizosphaerae]|uniref:Carboxymuconolactone decarboxylase family protein n=1 Tax=Egibacter rhizosphaerae TaxID=1670831 RepID=A0A411YGX1_9ACTN|nr:carboxymuconolactone decarboxylase family protein [Egibacter rhizosphaerae]QBI20484.1 carboxymuconolactone decarboxylase family protein [Egibacter rhizosphaerae]